MIIIINQKRVLSEVFFEMLKSSFEDFVNTDLKTDYLFSYTQVDDLVSVKLMETYISNILVNYADVRLEKAYENVEEYDLITEKIIGFIHQCVD